MSATISAWRVVRPNGRPARCLLSAIEGHYDVVVWNGSSIVLFEQHASVDEARHRADELWIQLVAQDGAPVLASR